MLRAVLVGLLCVSTFGCKGKKDEAAATQSGPAGTVLDVTGSVTVASKPLAKGATVAADDVVDTGADGHVIIELSHNQAKWELGPNKHEKVSASLAWTLAKNEGTAKPVDQDTSAAGRPAERSAADTEVTARSDEKKAEVAPAPAQTATAHAAAAAAPPTAEAPARAAAVAAPAPPPPPPPPPTVQPKGDTATLDIGGAPGGGGDKNMPAPPPKTKAAAPQKPSKKVTVPADDYLKCLKGITALHLVLHGSGGKTTYEVTGGVTLPADAKACVAKVTAGIKIEDGAHAEIDVSK